MPVAPSSGDSDVKAWLIGAICFVAACSPLFFGDYVRYIAVLWLIFSISAVGLQIPLGLASIYSFGHGAFMLIGAYAVGIGARHGLSLPLDILCGVAIAASVGAAIAVPSLRLSGFALAIVTMGAASLFFQGVKNSTFAGGAEGIPLSSIALVKLANGRLFYLIVLASLIFGCVVSHRVDRGPIGRSLRAAASNPLMAQAFGINLLKVRMIAFILSAIYGSVAGSFLALGTGFVAPEAFSPELSIQIFAAVMIGGNAGFAGPVLGALFIVLIPELTQQVQNAGEIIYAALFLLVTTFCPGGLLSLASVAIQMRRRLK